MKFRLACVPPSATAQGRRHTRTGRSYKTSEMKAAEELFEALLSLHRPKAPFDQAMCLDVIIASPYRKGDVASKANKGRRDAIANTSKPDCSNWIKGFEDCLTRGLFVRDDSLHVSLKVRKVFVPPDMAGVYVDLYPIPPGWEDCVLADIEGCI